MSDAKRHSLADHMLGLLSGHAHGPDDEHDHDHDSEFLPADTQAHEPVRLVSIGVDIGSSGTQVLFSRLAVRSAGLSRLATSRELLFQSPVSLTPFRRDGTIDAARVGAIVDAAFAEAGLHPDDIDTGVAVLTGEAATRQNAPALLHDLTERCGDLVSAAAGHHLEAALAAYGSGAVDLSHDTQTTLLAIDIGGSTTKLAWIDRGVIVATAALQIGGRWIAVDRQNHAIRLDVAAVERASRMGFDWRLDAPVAPRELTAMAESLADDLAQGLTDGLAALAATMRLTAIPVAVPPVTGIRISGGVGEYVYGHERRDFGDLGRRLGLAVRARFEDGRIALPLLPAGACIRATALGASWFQTQLSGATGAIPSPGRVLPRRNLPVWRPRIDPADLTAASVAAAILSCRAAFGPVDGDGVLAVAWTGEPTHGRLLALAQGIAQSLADRIAAGHPLFVILDGDVAQTLGGILRDECKVPVDLMIVDGLALQPFDYIDLGRLRLPSGTVPVTVKSLIFGGDQTVSSDPSGRSHAAHHHHDR